MTEPNPDDLAVVTVSYNSSAKLPEFLRSLGGIGAASEVVIADNASVDLTATRELAVKHGARVVGLPDNRGYGSAVNAAVETLPPTIAFVLISNPDVIIWPGTLEALQHVLLQHPSAGAVGPRILNDDGSVYPSARTLPSLRSGIGHALFARVWPSNPWSRAYRDEARHDDLVRSSGWLSGACLMVRREAFDALGGFDERYFMYFEDVDLGYRLGKAGWERLYVPEATVTHSGAHSTSTESSRMLKAHHDSAYLYLQTKYRSPVLAPLRWMLRLGLDLRFRLVSRAR